MLTLSVRVQSVISTHKEDEAEERSVRGVVRKLDLFCLFWGDIGRFGRDAKDLSPDPRYSIVSPGNPTYLVQPIRLSVSIHLYENETRTKL